MVSATCPAKNPAKKRSIVSLIPWRGYEFLEHGGAHPEITPTKIGQLQRQAILQTCAVDRFGEIVVHAGGVALAIIIFHCMSRQRHDRDVTSCGFKPANLTRCVV